MSSDIPQPASAAQRGFSDISGHWAENDINRLVEAGYVHGYPDRTFRPNKPVSRAEFIVLLASCLKISPSTAAASYFADTSSHWARGYIASAVARGILVPSEYPAGLKPDGYLKRSEAAAMMVRALGKSSSSGALPFKDTAALNQSMYKGFIKTAYDEGLISGYPDGEFKPFNNIDRGQACALLCRLLDKMAGQGTGIALPAGSGITSLTVAAAREKKCDIRKTPVYLKVGDDYIRISSISKGTGIIFINGKYTYALDSEISSANLVIYNNLYEDCTFSLSGDALAAQPDSWKLDRLTFKEHRYNPEFVGLYIGNSGKKYYLSDAEITGEDTLKISGKGYNLAEDKITVKIDGSFYAVKGIEITDTETGLDLEETDPVVIEDPGISDIAAIFAGTSTLNLKKVSSINFLINNKIYPLEDIAVDASGCFIADEDSYPASKVTAIIDGQHYLVNSASIYKGQILLYCTETEAKDLVKIGEDVRTADKVKILKDGVYYSLDDVLVVKRNVVRINGRQYEVDSSIKCRVDSKIYDIKKIDYDSDLEMVTIDLKDATGSYGAGQPEEYVFYLDGDVYQTGVRSSDSIYAESAWRDFDSITLTDPAHFTYGSSTYDLIGARVKIKEKEYTIEDTVWRGQSGILEIYLKK